MVDRNSSIVWLRWGLLAVLLALRVPSLVQPAGADQSLYAYIGMQMLAGGTPYLDGWDQKPPGIHALYALLWWIWPDERVVAAADLVAAIMVTALLLRLGTRFASPTAGWVAACTFALLANPAMHRLSGVFVRGQCETFIALAVTAAFSLAAGATRRRRAALMAGLLLGAAIWLKYNAVVFALPVLAAFSLRQGTDDGRAWLRDLGQMAAGAAALGVIGLGYLASRGALEELWLATFAYNASYSSEPYAGPGAALWYIVGLPFRQARHELLWWLGLSGVLLGVWQVSTRRATVVTAGWIGAAVVAIALNGRDLPQYFVQATPALALAAGLGLSVAWQARQRTALVLVAAVVAVGLWRIGTDAPVSGLRWGGLPGLVENLRFDLAHWRGRIDRTAYLDRFGGQRVQDKYAARDVDELARFVAGATAPTDAIYVFGFSPGVYVKAQRRSASRFFWSYPVVIGFASDRPGYGPRGVLQDLQHARPSLVALQRGDWDPIDSATFFLNDPGLSAWLRAGYRQTGETRRYTIWQRLDDRDNPSAAPLP